MEFLAAALDHIALEGPTGEADTCEQLEGIPGNNWLPICSKSCRVPQPGIEPTPPVSDVPRRMLRAAALGDAGRFAADLGRSAAQRRAEDPHLGPAAPASARCPSCAAEAATGASAPGIVSAVVSQLDGVVLDS